MNNKVFITFNPNKTIEENTAMRLQTLSSLYGIEVNLPARFASYEITKERIKKASIIVAFAMSNPESEILKDLKTAIDSKKTILIIYDKKQNEKIDFGDYQNLKKIKIDYHNSNQSLEEIAQFLNNALKQNQTQQKNKYTLDNTILPILAIGLGLLSLYAFTKNK